MSTVSSDDTAAAPDVRSILIEEAARILGEEGVAALSARRLAAGAGTSTMAVYTHFGAMGAVVDAVATEGFRRLIASVNAVGSTDDPLADLRRMSGAYRANARANRHLYGVMFGVVRASGLHRHGPDPDIAHAAFQQLVDAVSRAMDARVMRLGDPAVAAGQIWSALHGYVLLEDTFLDQVVDDAETTVLWPMLDHLLTALGP